MTIPRCILHVILIRSRFGINKMKVFCAICLKGIQIKDEGRKNRGEIKYHD